MLFDSRKSGRPGLRNAFRVTTQKILYGIVIGAAGTRGIYFTVQVCVCVCPCVVSMCCVHVCTCIMLACVLRMWKYACMCVLAYMYL